MLQSSPKQKEAGIALWDALLGILFFAIVILLVGNVAIVTKVQSYQLEEQRLTQAVLHKILELEISREATFSPDIQWRITDEEVCAIGTYNRIVCMPRRTRIYTR